jgi:hypothetical protein
MSLHPYLFFSDGTCREAMTMHHRVLGGQLDVMAIGDRPGGAAGGRAGGGGGAMRSAASATSGEV